MLRTQAYVSGAALTGLLAMAMFTHQQQGVIVVSIFMGLLFIVCIVVDLTDGKGDI